MAKKKVKKVNKSQAIRNYLKDKPDAGPKEVRDALKKKRITVSDALVSNVKAKHRRGKSGGFNGRVRGRRGRVGAVTIDDLVEARHFAERIGGLKKAELTIEALKKLQ